MAASWSGVPPAIPIPPTCLSSNRSGAPPRIFVSSPPVPRGSWTANDTFEPDAPVDVTYPDCIDVLRLARLLGVHGILPLVFYVVCNIDNPDVIVDGVAYKGCTARSTLDADDLRTYFKGRLALVAEGARIVRTLPELAAGECARRPQCTTQPRCRQAFQLLSLAAIDDKLFSDPSPIDSMEAWLDKHEEAANSRPCQHCDVHARDIINKRREEAWCKLGEIFGIAEWPAGKQVRAADSMYCAGEQNPDL